MKTNPLRALIDRTITEQPDDAQQVMQKALDALPKHRHTRVWRLVALAAALLLIGVPSLYWYQHATRPTVAPTVAMTPAIDWTQANFYRGPRSPVDIDMSSAIRMGPPINTFDDYINASQLTFLGTVTHLRSLVQSNMPYTLATVAVDQVLTGDPNKQGHTVDVMFMGGNITKKEMLAPVAMKPWTDQQEAQSDDVVTVESADADLPQIGKHYAIILRAPEKNTRPFNVPYAWPVMEGRGVFTLDADGVYRQKKLIMPFGGDSGVRVPDTERSEMTARMQALIKAKTQPIAALNQH
ncbi:hypothetical protein [Lacticaseibacillus saniviri]|uniref:Uncharacterized protein n=2 Tax=Lacticaseibacillus saniviri TaxID=931533 RepID=A0A0R2MTX7_9LACO|nr:hypothetical protein [Lacticaseibacillus saniviri]KRO15744.1 hypothetical protein IV56_GL002166 [Lacticaseibacillus saniviri JCM 17471 = DSM 24301]MCG4281610.1 hypothetical protein [Lacticaseibacillus saniviri]